MVWYLDGYFGTNRSTIVKYYNLEFSRNSQASVKSTQSSASSKTDSPTVKKLFRTYNNSKNSSVEIQNEDLTLNYDHDVYTININPTFKYVLTDYDMMLNNVPDIFKILYLFEQTVVYAASTTSQTPISTSSFVQPPSMLQTTSKTTIIPQQYTTTATTSTNNSFQESVFFNSSASLLLATATTSSEVSTGSTENEINFLKNSKTHLTSTKSPLNILWSYIINNNMSNNNLILKIFQFIKYHHIFDYYPTIIITIRFSHIQSLVSEIVKVNVNLDSNYVQDYLIKEVLFFLKLQHFFKHEPNVHFITIPITCTLNGRDYYNYINDNLTRIISSHTSCPRISILSNTLSNISQFNSKLTKKYQYLWILLFSFLLLYNINNVLIQNYILLLSSIVFILGYFIQIFYLKVSKYSNNSLIYLFLILFSAILIQAHIFFIFNNVSVNTFIINTTINKNFTTSSSTSSIFATSAAAATTVSKAAANVVDENNINNDTTTIHNNNEKNMIHLYFYDKWFILCNSTLILLLLTITVCLNVRNYKK